MLWKWIIKTFFQANMIQDFHHNSLKHKVCLKIIIYLLKTFFGISGSTGCIQEAQRIPIVG
jgi:hypothetical protein